jgi:hypothetical protein
VISPMIVIASTASMMSAGPLIGISGLGIPVAIGLAGFYSFRWLRNQ